jgi:hypothetical protein
MALSLDVGSDLLKMYAACRPLLATAMLRDPCANCSRECDNTLASIGVVVRHNASMSLSCIIRVVSCAVDISSSQQFATTAHKFECSNINVLQVDICALNNS